MYASGIHYTGVSSVSPSVSTILGGNNGLSVSTVDPSLLVEGQNVGQSGNPAVLLGDREIPLAGHGMLFTDKTVSSTDQVAITGHAINVVGDRTAGSNATLAIKNSATGGQMVRTVSAAGFLDESQSGAGIQIYYLDTGNVQVLLNSASYVIQDNNTSEGLNIGPGASWELISDNASTGLGCGFDLVDNTLPEIFSVALDFTNHLALINPTPAMAVNNFTRFGDLTTSPTARVHIRAGTGTANEGSLKIDAGALVTTPETGLIEHNVANFYATTTAGRQTILLATATTAPATTATPVFTAYYGGNTNALGDPVAWMAVPIGGTTYKLPLYT